MVSYPGKENNNNIYNKKIYKYEKNNIENEEFSRSRNSSFVLNEQNQFLNNQKKVKKFLN